MKAHIRVERDYGGIKIGQFVNIVYTDDAGEVKQSVSFDMNTDESRSRHPGNPGMGTPGLEHEQPAEPSRAQFATALRALADQLAKA